VTLVLVAGLDTVSGSRQRPVRRTPWFQPGDPVDPVAAFEWPVATPESEGLDSGQLNRAREEAARLSYLYSLLVVRNGHLVTESYFHGGARWIAHNNYSVSKSFTSAMVGVALDRGFLESLDQHLLEILPEYVRPDMDPRKHDITIRHLLMMRAGFEWTDVGASFDWLYSTPDPIRTIIDLPLADDPGARFNYCTPQTDLLAVVLARVTGMTTREFAELYLFDPLGIQVMNWQRDVQGNYFGGHGMFFTPRNMARLGQLYLNDGVIDRRRVLSRSWIAESLEHGARFQPWGPLDDRGYGYQWWLGSMNGFELFYAVGIGGQFILCFPELNMIVVTTANMWSWEFQQAQLVEILELVSDHVLPALSDSSEESLGGSSSESGLGARSGTEARF
jgi:CubicO group peptidase (beta-lactamase class C family)